MKGIYSQEIEAIRRAKLNLTRLIAKSDARKDEKDKESREKGIKQLGKSNHRN